MSLGDPIILLRPNLWSGHSGTIEKVVEDKLGTRYWVKLDKGFHAFAKAEEIEVIELA